MAGPRAASERLRRAGRRACAPEPTRRQGGWRGPRRATPPCVRGLRELATLHLPRPALPALQEEPAAPVLALHGWWPPEPGFRPTARARTRARASRRIPHTLELRLPGRPARVRRSSAAGQPPRLPATAQPLGAPSARPRACPA